MPGGSEQKQQSVSQASPYAPAQGSIDSILGKLNAQIPNADLNSTESGALDALKANASAGNPYRGLLNDAATGLLTGGGAKANDAGISSALTDYKGLLSPYASGSMIGKNDALKAQLDTIARDVSDQVNGQFAAAGRDFSGMNQQTLARGIAQGTAPVLAAQYNADTDRALNAANSIYGASNQTFGLLNQNNQQSNANKTAGIDVGNAALDANNWGANGLLSVEAQRRGIPVSNLQTLLGTVSPVGQAFGTNTSNTTSTTKDDPLKTALSAIIAGGTLASKFSDIRLKEDIARVGALADGTPVYRYRYIGSPHFEIGLIAQDIEKRTPEAVSEVHGFKAVDYHKATARAAEMEAA